MLSISIHIHYPFIHSFWGSYVRPDFLRQRSVTGSGCDRFIFPTLLNDVEYNVSYCVHSMYMCVHMCLKFMNHWYRRLPLMLSRWDYAKWSVSLCLANISIILYMYHVDQWLTIKIFCIELNIMITHAHASQISNALYNSHHRTSMKVHIDHVPCQVTFIRWLHKILPFLFPNARQKWW